MLLDAAINAFDADVGDMVAAAVAAERAGLDGVWVTDHFSGAVLGRRWTRDPFVCLGAIAAATDRIRIGVLVANVVNRHPAQLACAVNSLQSLAPDRVCLGLGSGAAPGSRFAVEQDAIGRDLADETGRRRLLADSIEALRAIWAGSANLDADVVGFRSLTAVVDGAGCPPIVIGASAWPTAQLACRLGDGLNLRFTSRLRGMLEDVQEVRPPGFEVSVLCSQHLSELGKHDLSVGSLANLGCDRLVVDVDPADSPTALDALAAWRRAGFPRP